MRGPLAFGLQIVVSPVIRRAIVSWGFLVFMVFLAADGVSVLTGGKISLWGRRFPVIGKGLPLPSRLVIGSSYLVVVAFMALLFWQWKMWRFL